MSDAGRKIIDGLRDAAEGNFAAVTIGGYRWTREQWQPIANAPRDRIILTFDPTAARPIDTSHFLHGTWRDDGGEPTHWMPLPSPPVST